MVLKIGASLFRISVFVPAGDIKKALKGLKKYERMHPFGPS